MYVRESGAVGSTPIVFLHGVGGSGGMWARHMAELAGSHCLAPDLRGFGRSNRLAWVSLNDTAERVAELIEGLPSRRAHVVGLSLGGSVAHTLLARRPELLDRVVIDGCGVLPWWGTRLIRLGVAAVSPFLHTRAVVGAIGRAWEMDEQARANLRAASPRSFRRAFADANDIRISRAEIAAPCPTLLLAGERETKPPVRSSNAALAALMPGAEARFAPGQGHGWLGRQPELHVRTVAAWLNDEELPPELPVENTPWNEEAVGRLLERAAEGG
jgi:pimeloyl-ACP methyl ester carboxylesterase